MTMLNFFYAPAPNTTFLVSVIAGSAVLTPAVAFFGMFFPGRANKAFGELGSKLFKLLDFPDADDLDMMRAGMLFQSDESHLDDI